MLFRNKETIAKFSDLTTEELDSKLMCLDNKSFGKFVTHSIDYEKGLVSKKQLEKEASALKLLEKKTLKNTFNRVSSIEEQYDGYKMVQFIVPFITTLLIVLGNNYFFSEGLIKQNGVIITEITFLFVLLIYTFVSIKAIGSLKKEHSKLLFFKFIVEECISEKNE